MNGNFFGRLALIALLIGTAARADLVKVDYATGINSSTAEQGTATQLVRTAVSELGHLLTDDGGAADYTLKPHLMRLDQSYVLTIEKMAKGKSLFSSQLKAAHLDELDKVASRVTRAVIEEKRASEDARVGEVTDQEEREGSQRRPTRSVFYLGFGGGWLTNLARADLGYSVAAAQGWDINRAQIRLFGDLTISHSAFQIAGGLGVNVFLTNGDISPYLGGDFGYGFAHVDSSASGETCNGFDVGVSGGVQFFRTSSLNLDIGGRLGFLLADTSLGRPMAASLRLGIYF